MDIIVCVKRVPETAEADIIIDSSGKDIQTDHLAFGINEWDDYAVEEAVRIKEAHGGTVTVVSLGNAEVQPVLRRTLAMGADEALLLNDPVFTGGDSYAIAKTLHAALKDKKFDLLLTGVQAGDDGYGQVGPMLGELFQLPSASMVTRIEVADEKITVTRELEGGMGENCELTLPSVLSIQTGINEPRYVSIMGLRKAKSKTLSEVGADALPISGDDLGASGALTEVASLYLPPVEKTAEMLEGDTETVSAKMMDILKKKGVVG